MTEIQQTNIAVANFIIGDGTYEGVVLEPKADTEG